eukprot:scaffold12184_cov114-Isochrysis_galbana.AAC.5
MWRRAERDIRPTANRCRASTLYLNQYLPARPGAASRTPASPPARKASTSATKSLIASIMMSAPRPSSDRVPCMSISACPSLSRMWLAPTYPTIRPTFALAAEPTPEAESSTAMHCAGAQAGRVDADGHSRLAGGGSYDKWHRGGSERLKHVHGVRSGASSDGEACIRVALLLGQEGRLGRLAVLAEEPRQRDEPELSAAHVNRECEGCGGGGPGGPRRLIDLRDGWEAGGRSLRVDAVAHELKGLPGVVDHKLVTGFVEGRAVPGDGLKRGNVGRELPECDVHSRRLRVCQGPVEVEQHPDGVVRHGCPNLASGRDVRPGLGGGVETFPSQCPVLS